MTAGASAHLCRAAAYRVAIALILSSIVPERGLAETPAETAPDWFSRGPSLQQQRLEQLTRSGCLDAIEDAAALGRPLAAQISPWLLAWTASEEEQRCAVGALSLIGGDEAVFALSEAAQSAPTAMIRAAAADSLFRLDPSALDRIWHRVAPDPMMIVVLLSAAAESKRGDPSTLLAWANAGGEAQSAWMLDALLHHWPASDATAGLHTLRSRDGTVSAEASCALRALGELPVAKPPGGDGQQWSPLQRVACAARLARLAPAQSWAWLEELGPAHLSPEAGPDPARLAWISAVSGSEISQDVRQLPSIWLSNCELSFIGADPQSSSREDALAPTVGWLDPPIQHGVLTALLQAKPRGKFIFALRRALAVAHNSAKFAALTQRLQLVPSDGFALAEFASLVWAGMPQMEPSSLKSYAAALESLRKANDPWSLSLCELAHNTGPQVEMLDRLRHSEPDGDVFRQFWRLAGQKRWPEAHRRAMDSLVRRALMTPDRRSTMLQSLVRQRDRAHGDLAAARVSEMELPGLAPLLGRETAEQLFRLASGGNTDATAALGQVPKALGCPALQRLLIHHEPAVRRTGLGAYARCIDPSEPAPGQAFTALRSADCRDVIAGAAVILQSRDCDTAVQKLRGAADWMSARCMDDTNSLLSNAREGTCEDKSAPIDPMGLHNRGN